MGRKIRSIKHRGDRDLPQPRNRLERGNVAFVRKHPGQDVTHRLASRSSLENEEQTDQVHGHRAPSGGRPEAWMLAHVRVDNQPVSVWVLELTVVPKRHVAERCPTGS